MAGEKSPEPVGIVGVAGRWRRGDGDTGEGGAAKCGGEACGGERVREENGELILGEAGMEEKSGLGERGCRCCWCWSCGIGGLHGDEGGSCGEGGG